MSTKKPHSIKKIRRNQIDMDFLLRFPIYFE